MALIYTIFSERESRQASVPEVRDFLELGGNVQVTGTGTGIFKEIAKDFPYPKYMVSTAAPIPGGSMVVSLSKVPSQEIVGGQDITEESSMNR